MNETLQRAIDWIVGDDTGTSSKAIWAHMMGAASFRAAHPCDPDDFGRCARLLDLIPEWKPRLPEMAAYSRSWARLVARWDEIRASMEAEVGIDWSKGHTAPETYSLMRAALEPEAR